MALYLGSEKKKINLNNIKYYLNFFNTAPITNGAVLKSSDNYILKDSDGLYLTVKEAE